MSAEPLVKFGSNTSSDMEHAAGAPTLGLEVSQTEGTEHVDGQHGQQPKR